MKLKDWYSARGFRFVYQRGASLLNRYGLTPDKAMRRIERCVVSLAERGCAPTFPTPGIIVQRYPEFIRSLQDGGVEIAVHGYQHVNLNAYPIEEARRQLEKTASTFTKFGIKAHGFRCPYLGCRDELVDSLPARLFEYSSNQAIRLRPPGCELGRNGNILYTTVDKFYRARDSADSVCVPWKRSNTIEIPVSTPDDLQLLDGLHSGSVGLSLAWMHMLQQTYQRGELFNLLFHPELAELCGRPFIELLQVARDYQPKVWIAKLAEISEWWKEKGEFRVEVIPQSNGLNLSFLCSPRATILARGLPFYGQRSGWDGVYDLVESKVISIPAVPLPFVGLPADTPEHILFFLREQGYILELGEKASQCGLTVDKNTLTEHSNEVQLINFIETSDAPLIRYGRWPHRAKSALSLTGDLDALRLLDYAFRLFGR